MTAKADKSSVWDRLELAQPQYFAEQIPPGTGFTAKEYATRYGIDRRTSYDRIAVLIAAGKVQVAGKRGRAIVYDVV